MGARRPPGWILIDLYIEGGKRVAVFVEMDLGADVAGQMQGVADFPYGVHVVEGRIQVPPAVPVRGKRNTAVLVFAVPVNLDLEGGCIGGFGCFFFQQFRCDRYFIHGV